MRWIAFGSEAEGVIAVGQVATGVVAVGQMATGVIAVGQVARGFVAIGQGAVGVFAAGMGAVGLVWTVGMVGVGGRGFGGVLPLVPSLGPAHDAPATRPARELMRGSDEGWVEARLELDAEGPKLVADGRALDVRFDARLRGAIETRAPLDVRARLEPTPDGWVCIALQEVPPPRWKSPQWWAVWAAQLAGLVVASLVFWGVAGIPVVSALFDPGGVLVSR